MSAWRWRTRVCEVDEGVAAVDRYNEHALEEAPEQDTKEHVEEYRKSLHSAEGSLDHELHVLEFVTEMLGACVRGWVGGWIDWWVGGGVCSLSPFDVVWTVAITLKSSALAFPALSLCGQP